METKCQDTPTTVDCPENPEQWEQSIRDTVDELLQWVRYQSDDLRLDQFEGSLAFRIALLGRLLIGLFLALRHQRLDLEPYRREGWRVKDPFVERTLKTTFGAVRYGRAYLARLGRGWHPLDAALGITSDGFSWRVIDLATRLATRVSYGASRKMMKLLLGWAPSEEAIERLAWGLGSRAPAYVAAAPPPQDDGEVLIIEVDGKAAPMATEAELEARKHKRKRCAACGEGGSCSCQRHRGRQRRRQAQGKKPKKRKKRGHNSKNGRSATLVALYTLKEGPDGKLHGPINKKIWGTFHSRAAAVEWARAQATRRGFGPRTKKTVQIVIDGESCLRERLKKLFPKAEFTLDLRHAQERLWKAGRAFHAEGSEELAQWVEPLNALLVAGRIDDLLARLREIRAGVSARGPNTRAKREALDKQIRYMEERREMMRYGDYRARDLVLATGVIEGACRYVVGERLDCAGMRWRKEGAEAVLHLRCLELNGDWELFMSWTIQQTCVQLSQQHAVLIRTSKPPPLQGKKAA